MSCPICISNFNKAAFTEVKCACEYSACKTCVRTYLLNTTKEPHCMNCRVKWSPEFTKNAIGATFINKEYREHITKQLLDQVIARREEYVAEAIIYRDDREDKKAIYELTKEMHNYPKKSRQSTELEDAIEDIQNKIENRHGRPPQYRNPLRAIIYNRAHNTKSSQKPKFIMACPIGQCNGMLDEQYCCQVCYKNTCSKCLEAETDGHVCNPDSIASAKAINRESKPCPKCGCRISKIDGCDQMWCIVCRTAFSWNTCDIEEGHIHNPHYYQYMREQKAKEEAKAEAEYPIPKQCSVRNDALHWMFRRLRLNIEVEREPLNYMIEYIRYTNHISEVTVKKYEQKQENELTGGWEQSSLKEIYMYILGEMDQSTLSNKLYLHKRAQEKNTMFLDVYKAIPMIIDDICQNIMHGHRNIETLYNTFQKYSAYFNVELLKLVKLFETKQEIDIFNYGQKYMSKQYDIKSVLEDDLQKYTNIINNY